jgi:uncharacterized Ntn-hydrolase superfamily protein
MSTPRSLLAVLLPPARLLGLALLTAATAHATWSIVVVDRKTGEVCIAGATCLTNIDLRATLTVIVVGKGGGAAQSSIDSDGSNRMLMWDGVQAGRSPERILADLIAADSSFETRQYGIATLTGDPIGFSGKFAGQAKAEIFCEVGHLAYAIQGNVLAGPAVCWRAAEALLNTDGDLSQRVIAAMEQARAYGGDGRCSCSQNHPDQCGSPPPDFDKSAHVAFMVLARLGDQDGVCDGAQGCANGNYYLALDVIGPAADPDPVLVLEDLYASWRQSKLGIPDQLLTNVLPGAERLVADGITSTDVRIVLRDLDGIPIDHGGQTLALTYTGDEPAVAFADPPIDNGDGTHTFHVTASSTPGHASWRVVIQQGSDVVQLQPEVEIEVDPLVDLHVGFDKVSVSEVELVPFVVNRGALEAGRPYQLLGSARGTSPGTPWKGLVIPLNRDRLFTYTWLFPNTDVFRQSAGALDAIGRAEASFGLPDASSMIYVGRHLDFCGLLFGAQEGLTSSVGFDVVP